MPDHDTTISTESTPGDAATRNEPFRRVGLRVRGIVQGVGFRPFVYQLAREHALEGWVRNQSDGVDIEVAGHAAEVRSFLEEFAGKAPPLARIVRMVVEERPFEALGAFRIVPSVAADSKSTLISPDVCTCPDCLRELLDPSDRRYRYPFINCTNCGPRYTIIRDIPYDRDKTTMAAFPMCPACRAEYDNPEDRRFHAQPNACPECGPRIWLEDEAGLRVAERDGALAAALRLLDEGRIVAVKGLGGFHLAVDATRPEAVARLRSRKVREEKPFAVMFPDIEAVRRYCRVSETERALLESIQRPIVLLEKRGDPVEDGVPPLAPAVAPRNRHLGSFLPYTPLHFLLFDGAPSRILVMTSGNQSDEPIAMTNEDARARLNGIADAFLMHDRDIHMRCDDSVIRVLSGKPRPIRRARGTIPVPVFLRKSGPAVLGVGAELKNTLCLTRRDEAFLSQHIGDLENLETLRSFEHLVEHLRRILEIEPVCIAHDLHPDYLSTQWALACKGTRILGVQHHHAHIASVVAERGVEGPVIGLALDGTGYGTDGTIWGGEILRVEGHRFERLGSLRKSLLPGGDRSIREPWRMAVSLLFSLDPEHAPESFGDFFARWPREKWAVILQMLAKRIQSPVTTSCGRLFDAVSALIGIRDRINYEGQAAIELEQAIEPDDAEYAGQILEEEGFITMDPLPMIRQLVTEARAGVARGVMAARFHNGMVSLLCRAAEAARSATGLERIALSGGVFQNATLSERLEARLAESGFEVLTHLEVPPNDACIALGQAHVAREWLEAGAPV